MMQNGKLTVQRVKNHFAYGWWKYALAAALCAMGISMLFDMTRYRPPADKKLSFYVTNGTVQGDLLQQVLWPALKERCPEQEELTVVNINLARDEMYPRMQYMTYIGAGEGDVLLVSQDEYNRLCGTDGPSSALADLSGYAAAGVLSARADALSEWDGSGIYGIPAGTLTGLIEYGDDPSGTVLCVLQQSRNKDTAAALIGVLQQRFGEGVTDGGK